MDDPTPRLCRHCSAPLTSSRAWFCGSVCRKRAYRRRRAGLPEDAYAGGVERVSLRRLRERRDRQDAYVRVVLSRRWLL